MQTLGGGRGARPGPLGRAVGTAVSGVAEASAGIAVQSCMGAVSLSTASTAPTSLSGTTDAEAATADALSLLSCAAVSSIICTGLPGSPSSTPLLQPSRSGLRKGAHLAREAAAAAGGASGLSTRRRRG